MVGAILTQATRWDAAARAIHQLKRADVLSPQRLSIVPETRLRVLIRSTGYFRQKAKRVKAFSAWYLQRYGGKPQRMFNTPWRLLRQELLALQGIGPETADAILLYAGRQPVFVIDGYTTRVFRRHHLIQAKADYANVQRMVMQRWPSHTRLYNEFHALLVIVGKQFCHRRNPHCGQCPLGDLPHTIEVETNGSR